MKFFIPGIEDRNNAEEIYQSLRDRFGGPQLEEKRYRAIWFTHNGDNQRNEVGKTDRETREPVLAIFKQKGGMFLVVTRSRGFLINGPLLTGESSLLGQAEEFDPD